MAKQTPHLVAKGGRFYFRMRVPAELVPHVGKAEVTQALGDVTKPQAEVGARQLASQWAEHFLNERHRLGLVAHAPAPTPSANLPHREPTTEEVRALAQLAGRSILAEDIEARVHGMHTESPEQADFGPGQTLQSALKDAISGRDTNGMRMSAEEWLNAYGLKLPAMQTDARRLLMTWAGELAKAQKGRQLRSEGEHVETPATPVLPESLQPVASLPAGKKAAAHLKLRDVLECGSQMNARGRPRPSRRPPRQ